MRDLQIDFLLPSKQYLDALFSRKAPIPTIEADVDADDRTRRQGVLELLTARFEAGFEQEAALKKWQNIVNMQDTGKHALWQQRLYFVATLDERDDKGALGKLSFHLGNDALIIDPSCTISKG